MFLVALGSLLRSNPWQCLESRCSAAALNGPRTARASTTYWVSHWGSWSMTHTVTWPHALGRETHLGVSVRTKSFLQDSPWQAIPYEAVGYPAPCGTGFWSGWAPGCGGEGARKPAVAAALEAFSRVGLGEPWAVPTLTWEPHTARPCVSFPQDLQIISTDESQVFVAVQEWDQTDTYNLYQSDPRGARYALVLEDVRSSRRAEDSVLIDVLEVGGASSRPGWGNAERRLRGLGLIFGGFERNFMPPTFSPRCGG